ncbi:alpha-1,6-mannosyltransferase [Fistulifera solaris]|uniref:Mannosyltransferase n=1 Tax=Fistulifera solaris TaxID=1519565 RepID=A0A1Z5JLE7_FISSO|nr:alpha-1,6-mannosyltransferase [Fistulifera solaris]|eukprot:GAX14840.1 alpha-1,6-mannosyltransferase [Fistulifera solaris]
MVSGNKIRKHLHTQYATPFVSSAQTDYCQKEMMLSLHQFSKCFLTATTLYSLFACPFSKVEESFGIQATHDLFYEGIPFVFDRNTIAYDHLQYPGVVPRTFLGPFVWSRICQLLRFVILPGYDLATNPRLIQTLARLSQLIVTLHAWFRFADSTSVSSYLLFITACQFHLPFYASRMLPNSSATILTLHCYAFWIQRRVSYAAVCLVFAAAVLRCDLILLLFTVGLSWFITRQLTVAKALRIGILTLIAAAILTVPFDSLMWQHWVWPEMSVLYYNTVLNKSSDWGVSAWHWYWTAALPKALLLTGLLVPWSIVRLPEQFVALEMVVLENQRPPVRPPWIDPTYLPFLLPALGFVALYSLLGHKEVRFLFPVLPLFNLCAAVGLQRLERLARHSDKDKLSTTTRVGKFLFGLGILACIISFVASSLFVAVSRWNYPGGQAMRLLEQELQSVRATDQELHVHIDVAAAMTGVSLFEQRAIQNVWPLTTFYKAGYESENQQNTIEELLRFTHLVRESEDQVGFHPIAVAHGNPRLDFRKRQIATEPTIYILERDGWR